MVKQGIIWHVAFSQGSVCKVYVKCSGEQVRSKAMRSPYLGRRKSWVPIEIFETEISIKKISK